MLWIDRALQAQLCLHRRRDQQNRFAPDRSGSRACDHRHATRGAGCGGSARQRRGERSEAARPGDREAEVRDRQASSRAVWPILGAGRDPRAAGAAALRAAGECFRAGGGSAAGGGEREDRKACPREGGGAGLRAPQAGAPSVARASAARAHRLSIAVGVPVTETLELIPRQWKVIQHVREKFSCRTCETITQPPAPSHPIARGRAGPGLLAHILFAKYGLHLPLNRQSATYAREGIDLDVSTLADWVGACAATLMPLVLLIRAYVFAAERIHADETTVPVQAKGQCRTGRLWTYVRDDQPFGGPDPPAAAFFYSPDRSGRHPEEHLASYAGLMQADAYSGFNRLYEASRRPGSIIEASCCAHARRKFFDLARINKAPIAIEAVERIDALFAIEREI